MLETSGDHIVKNFQDPRALFTTDSASLSASHLAPECRSGAHRLRARRHKGACPAHGGGGGQGNGLRASVSSSVFQDHQLDGGFNRRGWAIQPVSFFPKFHMTRPSLSSSWEVFSLAQVTIDTITWCPITVKMRVT